jgi:hypothetical protein
VRQLERELGIVTGSTSWRITDPLRRFNALRKRRSDRQR